MIVKVPSQIRMIVCIDKNKEHILNSSFKSVRYYKT